MAKHKDIAKFFYELGAFRHIKRQGFVMTGIPDPENASEHTTRATLIGAVLAELEGANVERVIEMLLIHDVHEIRTGEHNKLNARYLNTKPAEKKAFYEQLSLLPKSLAERWKKLYNEFKSRKTMDAIVAKDADWLETALNDLEWYARGYSRKQDWVKNVNNALETDSAKEMLERIKRMDPEDWWDGLKRMTHKKLKKKPKPKAKK